MNKFNLDILLIAASCIFFALPILGAAMAWWFKADGLAIIALIVVPLFLSFKGATNGE